MNKYLSSLYNNNRLMVFTLLALIIVLPGCYKDYLPEDRDQLGKDANFSQTLYEPVLGRTTLMDNNFTIGEETSQPVTFKILNLKSVVTDEAATELLENFPVTAWKKAYTGEETSIAQIEAKRTTEYHPLFEIREHAGSFIMWGAARSSFIRAQPDSGYTFDVEVSNSGGRRYFRDLKLKPQRERPYEPSNQDPTTGLAKQPYVYGVSCTNVKGQVTNNYMGDVVVFFHKSDEQKNPNATTLTFKFVDTLFNTIDPNKFNTTEWATLVHGFNMTKTNEYVRYDVAYPVPLVRYPTRYTSSDGSKARVNFSYYRQGFGNIREDAKLTFDFAIYEPGDWEMVFWFKSENPKFEND